MIGIKELNFQDYSITFGRSGANTNKNNFIILQLGAILKTNIVNNARPVITMVSATSYLKTALGPNHTAYAYIRFAAFSPAVLLTSNLAVPVVGTGASTDGIDRSFISNRDYHKTYIDISNVESMQINCDWQEPVDGYSPVIGDDWVCNLYYRISLFEKV